VRASYSLTERRGWLTLHGTAVPLDQADGVSPTFVGRRQEHLRVRIAARIDFAPAREGEEAGLVLYRAPRHRYELGVRRGSGGREVFVRQTVGAYISTVTAFAAAPGPGPLVLQIDAEPTRYTFAWGPSPDRSDMGTLGGSPNPPAMDSAGRSRAPSTRLQRIDAAEPRLLSTEVSGGFIGTYAGVYALAPGGGAPAAPAAFDWFDYEKQE
jgi:alpha-N-arabinofuranosidase